MALRALVLIIIIPLLAIPPMHADSPTQLGLAGSPLDLVNAVNALRATYGLPPYNINPILMSTAQAQADFLAVTETMTHAGPGGIGLTDRLLEAGYPLAGDISLGGFRAENITGGRGDMPAQSAVDQWMGDSIHLTTMISPDLSDIGAGVAVNNGRVYYVIDCARPTTNRGPQSLAAPEGGSPIPVASPPGVIVPILRSTPNAQGDLIHAVQPGQSLWQIAIAYGTKIEEIKALNNLFNDSLVPGQTLLIRRGVIVPTLPASQTPEAHLSAPQTGAPGVASISPQPTPRASPAVIPVPGRRVNLTVLASVIGIVVLALMGGAVFTWMGYPRK